MKTKSILTILLLNLTLFIFAQTKPLNQLDKRGNKTGKWNVYLDAEWKEITDSTTAVFCRYTFFEHGTNIYPVGDCPALNYKLEQTSNTKLLDGEYKWYDAKGKLSSVHVFKNGDYVNCKKYYPTGELKEHYDYLKKDVGQLHGGTLYFYDKKGTLTVSRPIGQDLHGIWPKMCR